MSDPRFSDWSDWDHSRVDEFIQIGADIFAQHKDAALIKELTQMVGECLVSGDIDRFVAYPLKHSELLPEVSEHDAQIWRVLNQYKQAELTFVLHGIWQASKQGE